MTWAPASPLSPPSLVIFTRAWALAVCLATCRVGSLTIGWLSKRLPYHRSSPNRRLYGGAIPMSLFLFERTSVVTGCTCIGTGAVLCPRSDNRGGDLYS
ncbi:hypothetical protein BJV74DRAFT_248968 [Russula compacta]|nr:hypothetical protein BJV74DRAFT_248968 [Russula compacta]